MKPESKQIGFELPAVLLMLAAFLAAIVGGQVPHETARLQGGVMGAFVAAFQAAEAPTFAHLMVGALVLGAFALTMLGRRVVQVPNNFLSGVVLIFFGLLAFTPALSSFKTTSIATAVEWLTYGFGFYAVVGCIGRRTGPVGICTAIFAGCVVLSLLGLSEYGQNKAVDPAWRIFALWNNPNALAAMLLVGFFLGVGLTAIADRALKLLCGLLTALIGLAMVLTQSRGALAVLVVGIFVFALALLVLRLKGDRKVDLAGPGAVIALLVIAGYGLRLSMNSAATAAGAGSSPLTRVADAGAGGEQSTGFRRLLWQTSIQLAKENPAGYGIGSFRYESARPGLNTQTVYAHSTYLQLLTEGSVVLPLLFVGIGAVWLRLALRGFRTIPSQSRILLTAVIVAVGAVFAHSLVDSDFYYFGIGVTTFMLLGVGLLLSADSVSPEFLFPSLRRMGASFAGVVLLCFVYFAYTEILRAETRGALATGNAEGALAGLKTLQTIAPTDGEAWYLAAQAAPTNEQRIAAAKQAVENAPSTRNLRYLANRLLEADNVPEATIAFERALKADPNSLNTLNQLALLHYKNGNEQAYLRTLQRLVKVEETSYFKVRSLAELVPTETYEARVRLADQTKDVAERRRLLREAVEGFKQYLAKTVPNVLRHTQGEPLGSYAGESLDDAKRKMTLAAEAAQRLAALEREAGDPAAATAAETASAGFLGGIK